MKDLRAIWTRGQGAMGIRGRRKVANEALARAEVFQLMKSVDRTHAGPGSVRFRSPLDDSGSTDCAPCGCQGGMLVAPETKGTSISSGAGETQEARSVDA